MEKCEHELNIGLVTFTCDFLKGHVGPHKSRDDNFINAFDGINVELETDKIVIFWVENK